MRSGFDFDELQTALQDKIKTRLPESKVDLKFEVRRPPLEATDASRRVAGHGGDLPGTGPADERGRAGHRRWHRRCICRPQDQGRRGRRHGPVRLGAHSNDAEYVQLNGIVPRLPHHAHDRWTCPTQGEVGEIRRGCGRGRKPSVNLEPPDGGFST